MNVCGWFVIHPTETFAAPIDNKTSARVHDLVYLNNTVRDEEQNVQLHLEYQ